VVKLITLNVETGQGQTLSRGFVSLLMRNADFAHALAQGNGARISFYRHAQPFYRPLRRLILDEKLGIEQRRLGFVGL
jgi:hypothetical protein